MSIYYYVLIVVGVMFVIFGLCAQAEIEAMNELRRRHRLQFREEMNEEMDRVNFLAE